MSILKTTAQQEGRMGFVCYEITPLCIYMLTICNTVCIFINICVLSKGPDFYGIKEM